MLQDSTADITGNSSCLIRWSSRDTNYVLTWHCNNTPNVSLPLPHYPLGALYQATIIEHVQENAL